MKFYRFGFLRFNVNRIFSVRFRTSERDEMESHVARHVAGGYRPNGKKRSGPVTPQRVR